MTSLFELEIDESPKFNKNAINVFMKEFICENDVFSRKVRVNIFRLLKRPVGES